MRAPKSTAPPPHTTISLVPDSGGHKPNRNENNICDVAQQHEQYWQTTSSSWRTMRTPKSTAPPPIPLSRSCPTPRVINPIVIKTTSVMLSNSMNNSDKLPRHLDGQWEHQNLLPPPPIPLSRLCQTPRVINPIVMRTTSVMLRNSRNNNDKLPHHLDGQWEHQNILTPIPLSRSCQTPRVINPCVMKTQLWCCATAWIIMTNYLVILTDNESTKIYCPPPPIPLSRLCQTPRS